MIKRKLLLLLFFFVVLECTLRFVFGFCDALLFESSIAYEYIAQPNQNRCRFGAHIRYNSYSQRSEEPDSEKLKILGLGDSVLFGGSVIDQDSIATTLFSKDTGIQMLNIATGSWGPDNCAAYLREKGVFGAKAMVLVCSSHDAYDVMSFAPVVGCYPTYPDKQYSLALWEFIDRYLSSRLVKLFKNMKQKLDPDQAVAQHISNGEIAKKSQLFNPGFDELKAIADSVNIPFVIYLHAEKREVEIGQYNEMGERIIAWAKATGTPLVEGLAQGERVDMYMDVIHLNERGQRHLARCLENIQIIN